MQSNSSSSSSSSLDIAEDVIRPSSEVKNFSLAELFPAPQFGPDRRRTSRYMTSFERARLSGTRGTQLAYSAPVYTDVAAFPDHQDPLEIANREMRERQSPLDIKRMFPDPNISELWTLSDLVIDKPIPISPPPISIRRL